MEQHLSKILGKLLELHKQGIVSEKELTDLPWKMQWEVQKKHDSPIIKIHFTQITQEICDMQLALTTINTAT